MIESTGISEPLPVAETFTFRDEQGQSLSDLARLDTLVTVVDGVNFLRDFHEAESLASRGETLGEEDERSITDLLIEQVEFADVILISKTDLISSAEREELKERLAVLEARRLTKARDRDIDQVNKRFPLLDEQEATAQQTLDEHGDNIPFNSALSFVAGKEIILLLGGMDKRIATPRLKSPRVKIEGGSVGIAGEQTGIYPVASPGGWQLIGRTPLKLYDSEREKPVLLESGQYIKFRPVTEEEYKAIEKQVENDTYQYVVYDKEAE